MLPCKAFSGKLILSEIGESHVGTYHFKSDGTGNTDVKFKCKESVTGRNGVKVLQRPPVVFEGKVYEESFEHADCHVLFTPKYFPAYKKCSLILRGVEIVKLADAIFDASRASVDDPIKAWDDHNEKLRIKTNWLNDQNFAALQYNGPNTNLRVGLADEHEWMGGASKAQNGIICNPNIPSEEVFTTPHAYKVDGTVVSTKPLSYQGTLIENIKVTFEEGKIVEASASKGQEVLNKVLKSDEGASRIGEVALVPHSSPISQSGIVFFNTLFDENASSHIALGQCYSKCFKGDFSKEEISKRGGNSSMIHIDWMIGSNEIDVDGIDQNGNAVPVFRKGEWAN